MYIKSYLNEKRDLIDSYLKSYFNTSYSPPLLYEAITYSLFAGGKRIRPIMAFASYEACGGTPDEIIPQASAIELIHTYSLIHDDLPAMDNDDLRRGKPSNHKVFGEAFAILAGDALLTEAFLMLTSFSNRKIRPASLISVIREIAMSAGASGMIAGQAQDILSEDLEPNSDTLQFIHLHKTAALIRAAVRVGAILSNVNKTKLKALTLYGENIGLVFQIVDDILDVEGTTEELGKTTGSDRKNRKMTFPLLFGMEGAKKKAQELVSSAIEALQIFKDKARPLREIAVYLMERKS